MLKFKKILASLLALAMLACVCGCGGDSYTESEIWVEEVVEGESNGKDTSADDGTSSTESSSKKTSSGQKSPNSGSKVTVNNKWKVNFANVGTKGANGQDYSNYNPYKDIAKYKGKTVKFATWIDHAKDEMGTPIENFYKQYGIKVDTVYCSQSGYIKEVLALIAAGNAPDIVVCNDDFPAILQVVQDITASGLDLNEPFWDQQARKLFTVNGKTYFANSVNGTFSMANSGLTFFNNDLLTENGIKTPKQYYKEGQWTWSNYRKVCQQVMALGDDYYGGYFDGIYAIGQAKKGFTAYSNGRFTNTATSPEMVAYLKWSLENEQMGLSTPMAQFVKGKAGVAITGGYGLKATGYFRKMDPDSLDFTYLPKKDGASEPVPVTMTRGYGIAKGSKNPVAAGYALRYLLDGANYDMSDNCFISEKAANFYYEMLSKYYKQDKYVFLDNGVAAYVGQWAFDWDNGADSPDQAAQALETNRNKVQNAVDKINSFLNTVK